MERIVQKDKPLLTVAHIGDLVILENEVDGKVVGRRGGFLGNVIDGRIVLTISDNNLSTGCEGENIQHTKVYGNVNLLFPKLDDVTHYYIIPSSVYRSKDFNRKD